MLIDFYYDVYIFFFY